MEIIDPRMCHPRTSLGMDPRPVDASRVRRARPLHPGARDDQHARPQLHRRAPPRSGAPSASARTERTASRDTSRQWRDNIIVNFGKEELKGRTAEPRERDSRHVDGDHLIHYLDSPEQSLLVIPCKTEVLENGGATYTLSVLTGSASSRGICAITRRS